MMQGLAISRPIDTLNDSFEKARSGLRGLYVEMTVCDGDGSVEEQ
jgi:hypothetical protein